MCPFRGIKCPHLILGVLFPHIFGPKNVAFQRQSPRRFRRQIVADFGDYSLQCGQAISNDVGLQSHHKPGVIGRLRCTNEDFVLNAAIYRQTINDNVP